MPLVTQPITILPRVQVTACIHRITWSVADLCRLSRLDEHQHIPLRQKAVLCFLSHWGPQFWSMKGNTDWQPKPSASQRGQALDMIKSLEVSAQQQPGDVFMVAV